MAYLVVALTVLLNVAANIFLKMGMREFDGGAGVEAVLFMMKNPRVYLAVFCYGWAFAAYGLMLIKLDVDVAYPMMTGAIALTLAAVSRVWLGESMGAAQLAGIALIVSGIFFLTR